MKCPKCNSDGCWRDSADVGVGIIYGPYGCPDCGWSESPEYDLSDGKSAIRDNGSKIDPQGRIWPAGSFEIEENPFDKVP